MARMIDANRLKDAIYTDFWEHFTQCHDSDQTALIDMVMDDIDEMPTLAPPNEPLTLDELLKMDGQPVYVVFRPDNSGDKPQFWALVSADKQHDDVYLLDSMGGAGSYDEIWANIEAIYRRPPEGEEDT